MREKPDELTAPGRGKIGFCQGALTDKVALVLAECPGETNVIRGYGAIRILPYDDVALFGAEHVHGLGAIGATPKRLHPRMHLLPDGPAVIRRHIDFEAQLAGEAHAKKAAWHAANLGVLHGHVRKLVDVHIPNKRRNRFTRAGPLHRDHRP